MDPMVRPIGPRANLSGLISAMGRPQFYCDLTANLADICQPDHIHIFEIDAEQPRVIASISRDGSETAAGIAEIYNRQGYIQGDPEFLQDSLCTYSCPTLRVMNVVNPQSLMMEAYYNLTHISERAIIWGTLGSKIVGLSIIRTEGFTSLSDQDTIRLNHLTGVVFPLLARHIELEDHAFRPIAAVENVDWIERTLAHPDFGLPHREQQVLARSIHGSPASRIATELGISAETVVCYRKRAYQKLGISDSRQLMLWYLEFSQRNQAKN